MVEERTASAGDGHAAVLPPRFDETEYRTRNPDLAIGPAEAEAHYLAEGRARGLVASPLALRENLIAMVADGRSVLEIGPFCNPLLKGLSVAYLDVLDADQLRARAREIGLDPEGCPAHIDYVGGLEQVKRRFDAVISSHAIEHQPDLIHHMQQIERILEPDGLFCLIIPDKRYCLDHFLPESTIAQVLQAHRDRRRTHNLASIVEHVALTTHNDSHRHWAGDHGDPLPRDRAARLAKAMRDHDFALGRYVDVHAWYFTPDRFAEIVGALGALGLVGLEVAGVYDTAHGRNEFCAVLRLSPEARRLAPSADRPLDIMLIQFIGQGEEDSAAQAATAGTIQAFARRHGYRYELGLGTQSVFDLLSDAVARQHGDWAVLFGPDSFIGSADFDLTSYLDGQNRPLVILSQAGMPALGRGAGAPWLLNLAHRSARAFLGALGQRDSDDVDVAAIAQAVGGADAVRIEQEAILGGRHAAFVRCAAGDAVRLEDLALAVRTALVAGGDAAAAPAPAPTPSAGRWAARFFHPAGRLAPLVEAPAATPDRAGAQALRDAWARMGGPAEIDRLPARMLPLADLLARGDDEGLASTLAAFGRSSAAQGWLGGDRQHDRARDPGFAEQLARWTHDKLVSLAEAVGCLRVENPEAGPWGVTAQRDPAELFAAIETALGADLSPPPNIGAYLGIAVGAGRVVHMRMLDAVYAAWRVRQLQEQLADASGTEAFAVGEIGGGIGLNAFYAGRLGQPPYRQFGSATAAVIQSYVTGTALRDITPGDLRQSRLDLLLNCDSLPDMAEEDALAWLAAAQGARVPHVLSINQEVAAPGLHAVAELIEKAGGYALISRHRHWMRAGHVEELYRRI